MAGIQNDVLAFFQSLTLQDLEGLPDLGFTFSVGGTAPQTFPYLVGADDTEAVPQSLGEGGLAVFPRERAEEVIFALAGFAQATCAHAAEVGLDAYLNANVHVGPALADGFSPPGAERFDVVGKTVNIAVRLGRRGITLSPQAFRCLSPVGRERLKKTTPLVTYRYRG